MARSKRKRNDSRKSADGAQGVRDSAQKIWLAGLGAFERARSDGPRVFEALVEQGRAMGARAVGVADQALRTMRESEYGGRFDRLEKAFGQRVGGSLGRLGELTAAQLDEFTRQVRELNERLRSYGAAPSEDSARPKRRSSKRRTGTAKTKRAASSGASKKRRATRKAPAARRRSTGPAAKRSRAKTGGS